MSLDPSREVISDQKTNERYVEQRIESAKQEIRPSEPRLNLPKITEFVWLITGVLEGLIGIRILLKLIAASPQAGFAQFVYNLTDVFLVPFNGLTATPEAGGAVLELSSLIGMFAYVLFAWLIVRIIWLAFGK